MSDNIEKRSLELEFKHAQFEAAVSKTLSSLDKLNKSLSMEEAKRGLEEFKNVSDRFDLSGISNALDRMEQRFESFGYRLKVNVFDKIIRYSEDMAKSITITPISTGYSEYGLLLDSIRTIKASTGETVGLIEGYLDELNEYSDKTIYSFSDMTRNIGKFTNAGVKLENATNAIQGIANAAALAGVSASQAEHAMYNFAQALSQGYVKYVDWKSIVIANMATVEFKQQLIDTATELGTITKVGDNLWKTTKREITATKGFEESLSEAWLTSDVLIKTLEKYADETTEIGKKAYEAAGEVTTFNKMLTVLRETAQSGWALSWRYVVGDYEEAKALLTDLTKIFSDIINKQADSRNLALKEWKELGGREKLLKSIRYILTGIQAAVRAISIGWGNVFGKVGGKQLLSWTEMLEKGSKKIKDFFIVESMDPYGNVTTHWTQNGKKVINISQGIASIFSIIISLMREMGVASIIFFKPILKSIMPGWMINLITILKLTGLLKPFLGMILDLATVTGMFFQNLNTYLKENKTFQSASSKFKDAWEPIRVEIEKAMNSFVLFYSSLLLGDGSLETTGNFLSNFLDILTPIGQILGVALGYAKKFFSYFFEEIKNSQAVKDFTNTLDSSWKSIKDFFTGVYESLTKNPLTDEQIAEAAKNTWEGILTFFGQVSTKLSTWVTNIFNYFSDIGPNLSDTFTSIWETVKVVFGQVVDVISEFFTSLDLGDKVKGTYDSVSESISSKSKTILDNITKFFKDIKKHFEENPLDKKAISEKITSIWTTLTKVFQFAWKIIKKIPKVFKKLIEIGKQLAPVFGYVTTVIIEFVKAFIEFGKTSGLFDLIADIFKSFGSFIEETFKSISDYIKENPIDIEKIKETAKQVVDTLVSFLTNPLESISKLWEEIKQYITDIVSLFYGPQLEKEIDNQSGKAKKNIAKKEVGIGDLLMGLFISSASADELPPDLAGLEGLEAFQELQKARQEIVESAEKEPGYIEPVIDSISGTWDSIGKKFLQEIEDQGSVIAAILVYADRLVKILAVGAIGYEIFRGVKSVTNLIYAISSISTSITSFKQGYYKVELNKAKAMRFVATAALIGTMATAIYQLAQIEDPHKMVNAAIVIESFYLVYVILESLSSTIKQPSNKTETGKGLKNVATSILALVVALGLIAGAVYLLNDIDIMQFDRGVQNLKIFGTTFVGFVFITNLLANLIDRVSAPGKREKFNGTEFLWIAASLAAFVAILVYLTRYKLSDFSDAFTVVGILMVDLVALMALMALIEKYGGPIPKKGVRGLLTIAIAIKMLIEPILILNAFGKNVFRPVLAVTSLILALGAALAMMSKIKNPIPGTIGIAAIIASIYILLNQIAGMASKGVKLDEVSDLIDSITLLLGGLGIALGGLTLALYPLKGILTTLGGVVKSLSGLSLKGLGTGLLGALGVEALVWVGGKVIGSLISDLIAKIYLFVGKLNMMSSWLAGVNVENFAKLPSIIQDISEFVSLIPEVKELNKVDALKSALGRLSVGFMLSSFGFGIVNKDNVEKACALIKGHIVPAMEAMEVLDPEFDYGAVASAFTAISSGFDLYGQFVKRAAGNLGETSGVQLVDEAGNATYNVEELSKFLDDIAAIVPDDKVMASIARFGYQDKEPSKLLSGWAIGINSIALAVSNMGILTSPVDFKKVDNTITLLNQLKDINNSLTRLKISFGAQAIVDKIGGMVKSEFSVGFGVDLSPFINGLEGFGEDIASLGNSFNSFGNAVSSTTIDEDSVNYAMTVLEKLRAFSQRISTNYGLIGATSETIFEATVEANKATRDFKSEASINFPWLDALMNDNKFERFSDGIADLGIGFHDFASAAAIFVDPTDEKKLLNAKDVLGNANDGVGILGALANIANELTTTGGLAQFFTGEKNLGKFASDVGSLGRNLNTFATEAFKIKWDDTIWETHIKPFFDYLKTIGSKEDGWLFNVNEFANGLWTLASGMSGFVTSLVEYFPENDPYTKEALDHMSNVVTDYFGRLKTAFTGSGELTNDINQFNSALSQLQILLSTEIETQPVITPVLDLSQITSDVDNLNNLITPNRMFKVRSINSNTQASDLQSRMFTSNGNIIINDDHSDVVSAVNKLGPKIDRLNNSLSNMKIVMNTGVLAGELTGPINKNLGKMASRGQSGS